MGDLLAPSQTASNFSKRVLAVTHRRAWIDIRMQQAYARSCALVKGAADPQASTSPRGWLAPC